MSQAFNCAKRPTARKPHQCEECGRTIEPGERYERVAAVWEGDFFTTIACRHCAVARVIVDDSDPYYHEGYYCGLGPWFDEVDDFSSDWQRQIEAAFRAKWRDEEGSLMAPPSTTWTTLQSQIDERWAA